MIYYDKTGKIDGVLFLNSRETSKDDIVDAFQDTQREGFWRFIRTSSGKATTVDDALISPNELSRWLD